ncbi:MAG TPA: M28 family peptidase [Nitrospirales bacterium]|nr:M28 family peptidase [Nitrospirales bacterium]HIN32758.1 M28 family peptidase [Nitrospirales bacterium]
MKPYLLAVMSLSALLLNSQLTQTPLMANLVKSNDPVATETSISVAELQYQINIERMRQHVYDLASPKMRGRDVGSDEGARAIAYIEDEFKAYGLKPWFGDDYLQPITTGAGANVAALLPGSDPTRRHELVLVTAHHDHLGIREGLIYPGADDNISAVALMLETARILAKHPNTVKRSILFISFDAEEKPEGRTDEKGSMFFVSQLSKDQRQNIALMIGMDLMAGEIIPGLPGALFVLGSEKSRHLSRLIQGRTPIDGLRPLPIGLSMVEAVPYCPWCERPVSDYDSFRQADIPFVFLSTGRSQYYHTPEDTPASLHYDKLGRNAAYLLDLTLGAANELRKIDDYDHDARDQKMDIAGAASLLGGVLNQPPQDIRDDTLKNLHKAQVTVAEFGEKSDPLSWFEYRRLQSISLRVQCAAARPSWKICNWL